MRFLLLSKADLFGNLNLNRLLPALLSEHAVRVCLSDRIFPDERGFPATDSFLFHTRDFLLERFFPALDGLARERGAELLTFAGMSRRFGVPVQELGGDIHVARARLRWETEAFSPDVILCCRHDFILPPDVYRRAGHGAYNLHSGTLPDYRGPFCSFWSMLNRDRRAGCSIHVLADKVDTGDIVTTAWVELDYRASIAGNLATIYAAGVEAFLGLVPRLRAGALSGLPQTPGSGGYYRQPKAGDCAKFLKQGGRFVDAERYRALLERYLPPGVELGGSVPAPRGEAI